MKIALVSSDPGSSYGGTEVLVDTLLDKLTLLGYKVEKIFHPALMGNHMEILETINAVMDLDLTEYDLVITFRFPSYLVNHSNKLIWLLHQFRPLMDSYGTEFGFPASGLSETLRNQLMKLDRDVFSGARDKLRVNSQITLGRLIDSTGVSSKILVCPLSQSFGATNNYMAPPEVDFTNFIFAGGRISPEKRQHLALLAALESGTKLVIGGTPDSSLYVDELARLAETNQVRLIPRRLLANELAWLYTNCNAVFYAPKNEDSYGFVAGEACYLGSEFITCTDSGDVVELGRHMGFQIAEPNYFDIASYFGKSTSVPENERRKLIRTKWDLYASEWEDVELWITQHLS